MRRIDKGRRIARNVPRLTWVSRSWRSEREHLDGSEPLVGQPIFTEGHRHSPKPGVKGGGWGDLALIARLEGPRMYHAGYLFACERNPTTLAAGGK